MEPRTVRVSSVIRDAPDAIIGVELGGAEGYQRLTCTAMNYQPQENDNVLIQKVGTQWVVLRDLTEGRTWIPASVALTVADAAPSPSLGYVPATSVHGKPGAIWLVRSQPAGPPTAGSRTVAASASRTWDPSNNWRTDDTMPRQGSFGSGTNKGLFFYPAGSFGFLAARTGVTARMRIRRADRGGSPSGPGPQLSVWQHGYVAQPAGEPALSAPFNPAGGKPGRGDFSEFALPASTVADLISGAAVGLAIASDASSQYLIAFGPDQDMQSGSITFNWTG